MWRALSLILLLVLSLVLVRTGLLTELNTPVEFASLMLGGSIFASIGFIVFQLNIWSEGIEAFFKERPASLKPGPSAARMLWDLIRSSGKLGGVGLTVIIATLSFYDRLDLLVRAIDFIVTKMGKLVTALTH